MTPVLAAQPASGAAFATTETAVAAVRTVEQGLTGLVGERVQELDPGVRVRARLDSFAGRGRSWQFLDAVGQLRAAQVADVLPALVEVERAVSAGLHAVGFVAYEAAAAFDPALATHPPEPGVPLLAFGLFRRREEAPRTPPGVPAVTVGPLTVHTGHAEYAARVALIQAAIAAGETYQVNYTLRADAPLSGGGARGEVDEEGLYLRLGRAQQAGYCALLQLDGVSVLSWSPELFFAWRGEQIVTRPMKGTRRRGRWPDEDRTLVRDLAASAKDRAENVMIVDLLRSDLGRLAVPGTVAVERLFEVETYPTVHQLTSTVRARVPADTTLRAVFGALFPSGSVTGAPKVRTMEWIRSVESSPRGVYCGAVGFVSPGEAVFNVAIRTAVPDRLGRRVRLGLGGGITICSDPAEEYAECLVKGAFLARQPDDLDLVETMRYEPGRGIRLLPRHLERLEASAAYFGFAFDREVVCGRIRAAVAGVREPDVATSVRLRLCSDGEVRIMTSPALEWSAPVRLAPTPMRLPSGHPWLHHKTSRREIYEPVTALPAGVLPLFVNERAEVTETSVGNVVVAVDRALVTPPRSSGLLGGVARAEMIECLDVAERVLTIADLRRASSIWVINAVRGRGRAELAC